jgi:hypothetical protein
MVFPCDPPVNLDALDPDQKFTDLAGLIAGNLRAPDLIAVEQIAARCPRRKCEPLQRSMAFINSRSFTVVAQLRMVICL